VYQSGPAPRDRRASDAIALTVIPPELPSRRIMRRRARQLAVGVVLVLAIVQTDEARGTAVSLSEGAFYLIRDPGGVVEGLDTPGSGRDVLPESVLRMVDLLRQHGVESYRYSERIAEDRHRSQRLIEGAWPIRFQPDARFLLSYLSEETDCEAVGHHPASSEEGEGVRLARCR
jgi:hypothetical protein